MIFRILIFSSFEKRKPVPISYCHPVFLFCPSRNPKQSLTCFMSLRFPYCGHFMGMNSYNIWSFVTGFFHLA